jgi:molybdopterin molybdotransferase
MLSYEDAFEKMMSKSRVLRTEHVDLENALGRILGQNVRSDIDMPPFNKAAMDGYACRREDLPYPMQVMESITAGQMPKKKIGKGQCSKILTGSPVPQGADCVIMVEFTKIDSDGKINFTGLNTADNICSRGEDIKSGELVVKSGEKLNSAHIATMAAAGITRPRVIVQPKVAVIATGSELVDINQKPVGAYIRDSNSYQIYAQLRSIDVPANRMGFVIDSEKAIAEVINKACRTHEIIIIAGGVSIGDFDIVPDVLKTCGFSFEFESVAISPGHPTIFGDNRTIWCFGLPGNPVANFIVFERFVKPFLYSVQGHDYSPAIVSATLQNDFIRKKSMFQSMFPVKFTSSSTVKSIPYHGAAHINSYTKADGLAIIPAGTLEIKTGSKINVQLL